MSASGSESKLFQLHMIEKKKESPMKNGFKSFIHIDVERYEHGNKINQSSSRSGHSFSITNNSLHQDSCHRKKVSFVDDDKLIQVIEYAPVEIIDQSPDVSVVKKSKRKEKEVTCGCAIF